MISVDLGGKLWTGSQVVWGEVEEFEEGWKGQSFPIISKAFWLLLSLFVMLVIVIIVLT